MNAGETSIYQGHEVALHPMPIINVSQVSGPGMYSHCCGNAVDYAAPTDTIAYAPFSGTITSVDDGTRNAINFVSDAEVWTLNGLKYVTARFLHSDHSIYSVGQHFNQGDAMYWIGSTGPGVTGPHLHLDQSGIAGDVLIYYFDCPGWGQCWALQESTPADQIFYLTGSEQIITESSLNFEVWDGSPIYINKPFKWWMSKAAMRRRRW